MGRGQRGLAGGEGADENAMSEPIRILIADDHAHFKAGVRALLLTEADLHVVGDGLGDLD